MALEINEKELRGIIILEPAGRLVLGQESMDFRGKVKEVLEKSDWIKEKWGWNTRIVLDLGNLSFVDSAGLGALIAARTSAVNRGAEMKLANLTKKTARCFDHHQVGHRLRPLRQRGSGGQFLSPG